jgi:hypothetical protein
MLISRFDRVTGDWQAFVASRPVASLQCAHVSKIIELCLHDNICNIHSHSYFLASAPSVGPNSSIKIYDQRDLNLPVWMSCAILCAPHEPYKYSDFNISVPLFRLNPHSLYRNMSSGLLGSTISHCIPFASHLWENVRDKGFLLNCFSPERPKEGYVGRRGLTMWSQKGSLSMWYPLPMPQRIATVCLTSSLLSSTPAANLVPQTYSAYRLWKFCFGSMHGKGVRISK